MTVPPFQLRPVGSTGSIQPITVEEAVVGRDRDCSLVIDAPSISRRHARISRDDSRCSIEDLGSTHGTFVEGIRIEPGEPVVVHHEYGIRFGELDFTVALGDGAGFEAPSPATPRRTDPGPSVSREEYLTRGSLLLRLGADDAAERELSWQAFHDQYAPIIRGFARKAGCPEAMRDDLVQEVMAGFFTAASRFEYDPSRGRFRGYLKTATVHAAQRMRHRQRGHVQWTDDSFLDQAEAVESCWTGEWRHQALVRAIAELRRTSRVTSESWDAFELYGVRGVSLAAAAEQLGMSEAAVQKAKSRVSIMVREELDRIRLEEG